MGRTYIQEDTTKNPIQMIGKYAGVCWGADVSNSKKNFKRGLECLENQHFRTAEFPDVYMILDGYSARMMRELYTHIGGMPTRLQASTRYINYGEFKYIIPLSIEKNVAAYSAYTGCMDTIKQTLDMLENIGVPREDIANLLPLGMESKMVYKVNFRTLMDMSHQRMCRRAYWEFRDWFKEMSDELAAYSDEWKILVEKCFMPKCEYLGYCPEKDSCGRKEQRHE